MSIHNSRYSQQRRFEYPDDDDDIPDSVKAHRRVIRNKFDFPGLSNNTNSFSKHTKRGFANPKLQRKDVCPSLGESDETFEEDVEFTAETDDLDFSLDEQGNDKHLNKNFSRNPPPSHDTGSKQSIDLYEKKADAAISIGDFETAIENLLLSFSENHNLNAIKRVGEILSIGLIQEYHETGYDGRDRSTNAMVAMAVGMFLTYVFLGGSQQDVKDCFESMAVLFHNPEQFATICNNVKKKLSSPEAINLFINEFYNR